VRRSAVKARTQAMNQLRALLLTGPAELRGQLRALSPTVLVATCARLRPTADLADPEQDVKAALRRHARRHRHLTEEVREADAELGPLAPRPHRGCSRCRASGTTSPGNCSPVPATTPDGCATTPAPPPTSPSEPKPA